MKSRLFGQLRCIMAGGPRLEEAMVKCRKPHLFPPPPPKAESAKMDAIWVITVAVHGNGVKGALSKVGSISGYLAERYQVDSSVPEGVFIISESEHKDLQSNAEVFAGQIEKALGPEVETSISIEARDGAARWKIIYFREG